MTSTWARNYVDEELDREYYAHVTKEGHPLQRQIPQTYQRYTGLGGETMVLDGSNRVIINSTLSGGPLILDASQNYNLHGRVIHILFTQITQSTVTFTYPNGLIHLPGTASTSTSLVWASGQLPTQVIADFYALTDVFLVETSQSPAPPVHLPAVLNYKVLESASNLYDALINSPESGLYWDPNHVDSSNTSTITYDPVTSEFTINTDGMYYVSSNHSLRGFLDRACRIVIATRSGGTYFGRTWGVTSGGLINQNLSLSWAGFLSAGDTIVVASSYEPELPAPAAYGLMNGINTQDTTASNFIQILQL